MTPKEKALELYNNYKYIFKYSKETAKICSIILVNEVLNIKSVYHDDKLSDYWEQVKQEIENYEQSN